MEHLVQIMVPLHDHQGTPMPQAIFDEIRQDLVQHFSGVTAHVRPPAEDLWREGQGCPILLFEVFCERLDRCWWHDFRRHLEGRFGQKEVHVRAVPVEKL